MCTDIAKSPTIPPVSLLKLSVQRGGGGEEHGPLVPPSYASVQNMVHTIIRRSRHHRQASNTGAAWRQCYVI